MKHGLDLNLTIDEINLVSSGHADPNSCRAITCSISARALSYTASDSTPARTLLWSRETRVNPSTITFNKMILPLVKTNGSNQHLES